MLGFWAAPLTASRRSRICAHAGGNYFRRLQWDSAEFRRRQPNTPGEARGVRYLWRKRLCRNDYVPFCESRTRRLITSNSDFVILSKMNGFHS